MHLRKTERPKCAELDFVIRCKSVYYVNTYVEYRHFTISWQTNDVLIICFYDRVKRAHGKAFNAIVVNFDFVVKDY